MDFISKLPDVLPDGTRVTADQKAETVAAIAAAGGFEAAAEVERQFTGIGRDLNLDPAQTTELRAKTEAYIAAGDNSPEAKAKFEAELDTIIVTGCRKPCAVSDINDPKIKSLFGVVVVATEKIGGVYNNASPLTQKLIGYGVTALGGVKGVAQAVVLSVAPQGVQDAIGKAGEAITVGADALMRGDGFGQVLSENQNKVPANPTFNQTTGVGLATSVFAVGGAIKAVKGKVGGVDVTPPQPAPIFGQGQATKGTTHAATSERLAGEAAAQPGVVSVHQNQTLSTISGGKVKSQLKPDVCTVNCNGNLQVKEVLSPSNVRGRTQRDYELARQKEIQAALGPHATVSVKVVNPDPPKITPPSPPTLPKKP